MKKFLTFLMFVTACFASATIQSTSVNNNQVTVSGTSFPASPTVILAGTTLTIVSNSSTQIVVTLPTSITAGSYDLEIDPGPAHFPVTIFPLSINTPTILSGFCDSAIPNGWSNYVLGNVLNLGDSSTSFPCEAASTGLQGGITPNINGLPIASTGTLKNLKVSVTFGLPYGFPNNSDVEVDFKVFINNTPTTLTCSVDVTGTTTTYQIGPTACEDVIDNITVNPNDIVAVQVATPTIVNPRFNAGANWVEVHINVSMEKQ